MWQGCSEGSGVQPLEARSRNLKTSKYSKSNWTTVDLLPAKAHVVYKYQVQRPKLLFSGCQGLFVCVSNSFTIIDRYAVSIEKKNNFSL